MGSKLVTQLGLLARTDGISVINKVGVFLVQGTANLNYEFMGIGLMLFVTQLMSDEALSVDVELPSFGPI